MAHKQSYEISLPDVATPSMAVSTKSLVDKESKKQFSIEFWWKITITLAVIIIAGFMIYKAVDDNKNSSTKTILSPVSNEQKTNTDEESKEENILDCRAGSIVDSQATFTYQPYNSDKLYTTQGLEFSFEGIKKKLGDESGITELPGAHYYYNIPRCEIGGKVQLDKEPIIRGPIVFAVDEQCTKAHYFSKGWKEYSSARNINCSAHGKEVTPVEESECLEGSIRNSNSSFVYLPHGASKTYRTSGVEFSFEMIAKKTKLGSRLTKLDKLIASTSRVHYYYNIPRCKIGGGIQLYKEPIIRGPLIFAVDEQCSKTYYFNEGKGWRQYISARDITCLSHGKTRCFKDSLEDSYSTFSYISPSISKRVNATGIQHNFTKLVEKLQYLTTDFNLTKIPELPSSQEKDASYYLNLHRCYNGGPHDLGATPPIGGPSIFAVNDDCTKVYYLSSSSYQWTSYISAASIKCFNRQI